LTIEKRLNIEYEEEDIINIAWGDAIGGYGAAQLG
jgi:hypothetical protein